METLHENASNDPSKRDTQSQSNFVTLGHPSPEHPASSPKSDPSFNSEIEFESIPRTLIPTSVPTLEELDSQDDQLPLSTSGDLSHEYKWSSSTVDSGPGEKDSTSFALWEEGGWNAGHFTFGTNVTGGEKRGATPGSGGFFDGSGGASKSGAIEAPRVKLGGGGVTRIPVARSRSNSDWGILGGPVRGAISSFNPQLDSTSTSPRHSNPRSTPHSPPSHPITSSSLPQDTAYRTFYSSERSGLAPTHAPEFRNPHMVRPRLSTPELSQQRSYPSFSRSRLDPGFVGREREDVAYFEDLVHLPHPTPVFRNRDVNSHLRTMELGLEDNFGSGSDFSGAWSNSAPLPLPVPSPRAQQFQENYQRAYPLPPSPSEYPFPHSSSTSTSTSSNRVIDDSLTSSQIEAYFSRGPQQTFPSATTSGSFPFPTPFPHPPPRHHVPLEFSIANLRTDPDDLLYTRARQAFVSQSISAPLFSSAYDSTPSTSSSSTSSTSSPSNANPVPATKPRLSTSEWMTHFDIAMHSPCPLAVLFGVGKEKAKQLAMEPSEKSAIPRVVLELRLARSRLWEGVPQWGGPSPNNRKVTLYKTEICRGWEETGSCKYGVRCQFAHGTEDLRVRVGSDKYPKYKHEVCENFWYHGLCQYGKRCCLIHTTTIQGRPSFPPPDLIAQLFNTVDNVAFPSSTSSGSSSSNHFYDATACTTPRSSRPPSPGSGSPIHQISTRLERAYSSQVSSPTTIGPSRFDATTYYTTPPRPYTVSAPSSYANTPRDWEERRLCEEEEEYYFGRFQTTDFAVRGGGVKDEILPHSPQDRRGLARQSSLPISTRLEYQYPGSFFPSTPTNSSFHHDNNYAPTTSSPQYSSSSRLSFPESPLSSQYSYSPQFQLNSPLFDFKHHHGTSSSSSSSLGSTPFSTPSPTRDAPGSGSALGLYDVFSTPSKFDRSSQLDWRTSTPRIEDGEREDELEAFEIKAGERAEEKIKTWKLGYEDEPEDVPVSRTAEGDGEGYDRSTQATSSGGRSPGGGSTAAVVVV